MIKSIDSYDERSQARKSSVIDQNLQLSLRKRQPSRTKDPRETHNSNKYDQDSISSHQMIDQEKSAQRYDSTPQQSPHYVIPFRKENPFTRAARKREIAMTTSHVETIPTQETKTLIQDDNQVHVEELKNAIQKHIFINKWYQGPQEKISDNIFIKDDKIIIIEDDEDDNTKQEQMMVQGIYITLQQKEELLTNLVQQKINPIDFIIGDKKQILEQMRAQEDRINKLKKETEAKKLIKNSDVRMTIYPAYDNFFKRE